MLSQITQTMVAAALLAKAAAATELAAYWGQNSGNSQTALRDYCLDSTADIFIISFVTKIDPLTLNLANICGTTFEGSDLLNCPAVGADIKACQAAGKKVLLSVGGQGAAGFASDTEGTNFATELWNKFGGGQDDQRPFGDAVVDGFDLDLEHTAQTGTVTFGNTLKSLYNGASKKYYLSGSPQCPFPDQSLGAYLTNVPVDYTFVQFYNNNCNIDGDFNFAQWSQYVSTVSPNKDNKIFIGLPGSAASAGSGFTEVASVQKAVEAVKCDPNFGGISVWDASSSWSGYAQSLKSVLEAETCPPPVISSAIPSAVVSTSAGPYANSTNIDSTATATEYSTAHATITSCSDHQCTKAPVTDAPATLTATNVHTTVITVTSCDDHKCTEVPVTTGLTTVTALDTIYTTYCPLSTEEKEVVPSSSAPASVVSSAPVTASASSAPVVTHAPVSSTLSTETVYVASTLTKYHNGTSTQPPVIATENMGVSIKGSFVLIAISIFASLF